MPTCSSATSSRLQDCYERMDEMPLGSGALASTTYPIDRDFVREQLGFARLTDNSLDGVSDRDYCVELLSALSILMMHLSRLSEEIIFVVLAGSSSFVELDDAYSTGSSIMPQKKNPDVCELIRGKTGRVYGDADDHADRAQGPAAGVQQGHAGGQGGCIRCDRHRKAVP